MSRVANDRLSGEVLAPPDAAHRHRRRAQARRKLWLQVHAWLGLLAGAVFVLMGLTGSVNVFRWDIDEWLNPELVADNGGRPPQSMDAVFRAIQAAHPTRNGAWSLEIPRHSAGMITARHFSQEPDGSPQLLFVSVDPFTARIVANRVYSDFGFLVTWIYRLHGSFFLGDAGAKAVGVLGLLAMLSLGSGLYLWWPRSGRFRRAFAFKRGASSARLTFDIHKLAGVYGLAVLFALAFSGAMLIFSDDVRPVVAWFSPVDGGFNPQPSPPAGLQSMSPSQAAQVLSLESAMAVATGVFPDAEIRFVKTPDGPLGFFGVQMHQPGEASLFFTTTTVWIDQYTGQVLAVRDPSRFTAGERFLNLMWPLHNGEVLGLPGRILVFISGVLPLVLYITGVVRWMQKRRARSSGHRTG